MAFSTLRSILTRPPRRPFRTLTLLWALFAAVLLYAIGVFYKDWFYYEDDVYISLRYARNLLDAKGLSWNPGERVEGYTNFLYTLLTAVLGWLGMDLRNAAHLLSFTGYAATLAVLYSGLRRLRFYAADPDDRTENLVLAVPLALAAGAFGMLYWACGALEGTVFTALNTAAVLLVLRGFHLPAQSRDLAMAGALFALAALTRPEGALFFGLTGLYLFLYRWRYDGFLQALRHCLLLALPFLLILVPYLLWKIDYFGGFLPNTWYAKNYGIPLAQLLKNGTLYLLLFILVPPFFGILALYFFFAAPADAAARAPLCYLSLLVFVFLLLVVREGGDFMGGFRLFVPAMPLIALQGFYCMGAMANAARWQKIKNIAFFLVLALLLQFPILERKNNYAPSLAGFVVADYIKAHWPRHSVILLNAAGTLPYLANEYRYIDGLGLNDPVIARRIISEFKAARQKSPGHMKGDGAYALARRPDYILLDLNWGMDYTGREPHYLTDYELWNDPEFHKQYVRREVWLPLPEPYRTPLFLSRLREGLEFYYAKDPPEILRDNHIRFLYYERIKHSHSQ